MKNVFLSQVEHMQIYLQETFLGVESLGLMVCMHLCL
jgi:hypothetical protein